MRYDGGARVIRTDGSIEIVGRARSFVGAVTVAFLVGSGALLGPWPDLVPLLYVAWLAAVLFLRSPRFAMRRVVFDSGARTLHVSDRGWTRRDRSVPFSKVRSVTVEQREPRRIANAPPVLAVDGEELLSVQDTYANADLERELQALVGLPLRASPRDHDAVPFG